MTTLSEEEKQKIIEEEEVRAEARRMYSQASVSSSKQKLSKKQVKVLIGSIVTLVAIPFVAIYWYVVIPAILLAVLWLWKKITLSKKKKLYVSGAIIALFVVVNASLVFANRAPSIKILEPADKQAFQTDKVLLKGKVSPRYSIVIIRGTDVTVASDGTFEQNVSLLDEINTISVRAENGEKAQDISLTINRTFTEEEKQERDRLAKEQAERRAKQAKERVEQQAKQAEIDAKNKAEANEKKDGDVAGACAQMYMEQGLKAPSTAKFGVWHTTPLGKNKYTVDNYVDAQNGFGAMLRTSYSCTVTVIDPEKFACSTNCKF